MLEQLMTDIIGLLMQNYWKKAIGHAKKVVYN
jgi:hypothetical protein